MVCGLLAEASRGGADACQSSKRSQKRSSRQASRMQSEEFVTSPPLYADTFSCAAAAAASVQPTHVAPEHPHAVHKDGVTLF